MAKGDHKRVQNELDRQYSDQSQYLGTLSNRLYDTSNMFTEGYRQGLPMNLGSYDEIMHNYRQFMQNPFGGTMGYGSPYQSGYFNPAPQQFGGGQQGGDILQQVMQMAQSMPANRQSMDQIVKHFQSQGIPISIATRGGGTARSDDKIVLPDGRVIDMGGDVDEHTGQFKGGWAGNVIDIFSGNNKVLDAQGNFVNYGDYLRSQGVNNIPQGVTPELAAQYGFDTGGSSYEGELADFYRNLMSSGAGAGWDDLFRGALSKAIGTYGEFADTGGLSERDRQDLRARGEGAVRAVYGHAVDQLNRNRALQPFSPNYNASLAKMARERSYANADALTMNNAEIARMVQQGRLAGAGGLTNAGLGGQGLSTDMDRLNLQGKLAGASGLAGLEGDNNAMALATAGMRLDALRGMSGLYGTTPGLINTFGNQVLGANNQLLGLNELRQGLGSQMINGRLAGSQVPGNWSQAMGNIGSTLGLIGRGAGAISGLGAMSPFGGGGYTANAVNQTANSIGGSPWWQRIFAGGGSSGQWDSPYGAFIDNFTGVSNRYGPVRNG